MSSVIEEKYISTIIEEEWLAPQDAAINKQELPSYTFDGRVISMTGSKLVMTNKEGKECSHTLATDAKLTCDGKVCETSDLKAGMKIRVTKEKDDRNVAASIESLSKNANFAECGSTIS